MQQNHPENMINQQFGLAKRRNEATSRLARDGTAHEPPILAHAVTVLLNGRSLAIIVADSGQPAERCSVGARALTAFRGSGNRATYNIIRDGRGDGFAFSEAQQHWYDAATRFAREELVDPEAASREQRGEFWREGYQRCARFGILGLPVPAEYGGQGQDLATTVAAVEGLGYGCPDTGLVFGTGASIWTVTMPILALRHRRSEETLPARPVRRPAPRGQRRQRARSGFRYLRHGDARRPAR